MDPSSLGNFHLLGKFQIQICNAESAYIYEFGSPRHEDPETIKTSLPKA
ncbi:MAG: hypothetical protein QW717_06100 [Candidatus Bathyarchaeia archaeon]